MNMWAAIVVIVAIISVAQVLQAKYRARHGITTDIMGNETPIAPPHNPALEREVEELRERVKVLERIATEERETKLLSAEIESLREK
jgi:hypothetical protein